MDYLKHKTEFYEVLTMNGRHVLTEKTIKTLKIYAGSSQEKRTIFLYDIMHELPNIKLWSLKALAQGMKLTAKDEKMFLQEVEIEAVEIMIARRKK